MSIERAIRVADRGDTLAVEPAEAPPEREVVSETVTSVFAIGPRWARTTRVGSAYVMEQSYDGETWFEVGGGVGDRSWEATHSMITTGEAAAPEASPTQPDDVRAYPASWFPFFST